MAKRKKVEPEATITVKGNVVDGDKIMRATAQLETDIRIRTCVKLRIEADRLADHFKSWMKRAAAVEAVIDATEKEFASRTLVADQSEMFPADEEADQGRIQAHTLAIAALDQAAAAIGQAEEAT